mmetsp:Transcript_61994/g.134394  ORF Transcript_61994/g.134394 Transcript_61994/m.134394 type:complete len:92 (-) Transcript_61994:221-496(-)
MFFLRQSQRQLIKLTLVITTVILLCFVLQLSEFELLLLSLTGAFYPYAYRRFAVNWHVAAPEGFDAWIEDARTPPQRPSSTSVNPGRALRQ